MRHIRSFMAVAVLAFTATFGAAQNKVNPSSGINWPASCSTATSVYNYLTNQCIPAGGVVPITFEGAWSSTTPYLINQAVYVSSTGSTYVSILPSLNQPPASSPTYWTVLVAGGGSSFYSGTPTVTVSGTASTGCVAVATSSTAATCRQLTPADIAPAFTAVFNCNQCGTYETGYTGVTSASGTNTYANPTVPTSASVSDGTHTTTLTTPFASWTLPYTYSTNTTFTLTAVGNGQTLTPTATIQFAPRTFGGVGTASATGATASGTSATLTGATGTLTSAGLNNQGSYGPYTPSGQKIYILMTGSGHTFTSGGFAFPMNAPIAVTFVNQYGSSVTMYLYESTNTLSATFTIVVAS